MINILTSLLITIFAGTGFIQSGAMAADGDNPRIDRSVTQPIDTSREPIVTKRFSIRVEFIAGSSEISDADYARLYAYLSGVTADGVHRKITIAVWPDMVGENAIDETHQDLVNSRISEITAILADQGFTGDIETRNMATTTIDPNTDPELLTPAPASAVILIEGSAPQTSLSH